MTTWLLSLYRLFLPVAYAGKLENWGAGAPGVDEMWSAITGVFVLNPEGGTLNAVIWFSTRITMFVASLSGGVAVAMVMYAGIRMIYGGEEGRDEAKKIIMYALMGVAFMMLASVAIGFIVLELHLLLN